MACQYWEWTQLDTVDDRKACNMVPHPLDLQLII